jgi:hypothetical protein
MPAFTRDVRAGGENGVNRAGIEEIFKKSREMDVEFLMEEIPQAIEQSLEGLGVCRIS